MYILMAAGHLARNAVPRPCRRSYFSARDSWGLAPRTCSATRGCIRVARALSRSFAGSRTLQPARSASPPVASKRLCKVSTASSAKTPARLRQQPLRLPNPNSTLSRLVRLLARLFRGTSSPTSTSSKTPVATGSQRNEAEPSQVRWIELKELRRLEMETSQADLASVPMPSSTARDYLKV
jgi:hypothetical protein